MLLDLDVLLLLQVVHCHLNQPRMGPVPDTALTTNYCKLPMPNESRSLEPTAACQEVHGKTLYSVDFAFSMATDAQEAFSSHPALLRLPWPTPKLWGECE